MAIAKPLKMTIEAYNRISSIACDIKNDHIGEIVYSSNGHKLYIIN